MGEWITLTAADGHALSAWQVRPASTPKAGLVLVQEAFGVNAHIRDVAGRFAALGYLVVAPAMYDRVERGFEVGYGEADIARGIAMLPGLDWDKALLDVDAARAAVCAMAPKAGIIGYCFGGSMAWLSACRLSFDAAVCYYGSRIPAFSGENPHCPLIAHFIHTFNFDSLFTWNSYSIVQPVILVKRQVYPSIYDRFPHFLFVILF